MNYCYTNFSLILIFVFLQTILYQLIRQTQSLVFRKEILFIYSYIFASLLINVLTVLYCRNTSNVFNFAEIPPFSLATPLSMYCCLPIHTLLISQQRAGDLPTAYAMSTSISKKYASRQQPANTPKPSFLAFIITNDCQTKDSALTRIETCQAAT